MKMIYLLFEIMIYLLFEIWEVRGNILLSFKYKYAVFKYAVF